MQKLEFIRQSGPFIDSDEGQHPTAEFRLFAYYNDFQTKVLTLSFAAFSSSTDITPINGTERTLTLTDNYWRDPIINDNNVVIDYGFPSYNYGWSMLQTSSKGLISIVPGKESEIMAFLLNEDVLNVASFESEEEKLADGWQVKTTQ